MVRTRACQIVAATGFAASLTLLAASPADVGARNHGQFVSCVAHVANDARKDGLITGAEKGAVQQCAAQARVP